MRSKQERIPQDMWNVVMKKYPVKQETDVFAGNDQNTNKRKHYIKGRIDERADTLLFVEWIAKSGYDTCDDGTYTIKNV